MMIQQGKKLFLPRHTELGNVTEDFYLSADRMPYYHTNMIVFSAYGDSVYKPGEPVCTQKPYWGIRLIRSGVTMLEVLTGPDPGIKKATAGDIIITRPGMRYINRVPARRNCRIETLLLNCGHILSLLGNQGSLAPVSLIPGGGTPEVCDIYEKIRQIVMESSRPEDGKELSTLTYSLLIELAGNAGHGSYREDFNNIVREVGAELDHPASMAGLAKKYGTGQKTLTRLFQKHLHKTPTQYRIACRMEYAAQLLADDSLSIRSIAEACGYHTFPFFSKVFKDHFKVSPREYRKKLVITEAKDRDFSGIKK